MLNKHESSIFCGTKYIVPNTMDINNEQHNPDYKYTNPETGVLRNKFNITNRTKLNNIEYNITGILIAQLKLEPIIISNVKDIQKMHKMLFEKIYEWAGELREIKMWQNSQVRAQLPSLSDL